MKLKELPISLYKSYKLQFTNRLRFIDPSGTKLPLIVSLTTIPSRIHVVHITIKSILIQKNIPEKIILWVNDEITEIPRLLKDLQSDIFEIRKSKYKSPHRKLLHTLEAFPEKVIVTSDDDCIYREGWLESLYNTFLLNKDKIIANRLRSITYNDDHTLLPYSSWKYDANKLSKYHMPIGAEGVLYPPNCFSKEILDFELAHTLSPRADDLWYKAMSLKRGTKCILAQNRPHKAIPLVGTQKISLKKENVDNDLNRVQWDKLSKHFNLEL